jgi:hypothetical protein
MRPGAVAIDLFAAQLTKTALNIRPRGGNFIFISASEENFAELWTRRPVAAESFPLGRRNSILSL